MTLHDPAAQSEVHAVTVDELKEMLDARDKHLLSLIRTEMDERLVPLTAALELRTTPAQVDKQIQDALEPVGKQISAFTTELTASLNSFKTALESQFGVFAHKQEVFNNGMSKAVEILSGQRDAQIEDLKRRDGELALQVTRAQDALSERIEALTSAHNEAALRLNIVYDDVRGGEGRVSLNEMLSKLVEQMIPSMQQTNALALDTVRRDTMAAMGDLSSAINAMRQDFDRDHQFVDVLRKTLSWKTAASVLKTGAKWFNALPFMIKLMAGLTAGIVSAEALAPDAVAAFLDWFSKLGQ